MAYLIRSKTGLLIATISNVDAGRVIEQAEGEWITMDFKSLGEKTVFKISEAASYGMGKELRVHLFDGHYLIKD